MMQVIICGTFFNEFERTRQVVGFASAFAFMLVGLYVISQAPRIASDPQTTDQMMSSPDLLPAPSVSRTMRKGVISSGELGNQMQSRRSLSDLLLVRDQQLSAV